MDLGAASLHDLAGEFTRRVAKETAELDLARRELAEKEAELRDMEARISGLLGDEEDVLEVNVGGRVHTVSRGTLCLAEGSLLAALFSGRWDEGMKRDSEQRPFLDADPDCFEQVLLHLRLRRIAGPGEWVPVPDAPGKQRAMEMFLNYFGLNDFVFLRSPAELARLPTCDRRSSLHALKDEVRGYSLTFTAAFRLTAVRVGIEGDVEGCRVSVSRDGEVLQAMPLTDEAAPQARFDVLVQPPECAVMVHGNGRALVRYVESSHEPQRVGCFLVSGAMFIPTQANCYQPVMVLEGFPCWRDRHPSEAH